MEQESDTTRVKSWLGAQCPCDLGHLPVGLGLLRFHNGKSCIPESPGSQTGSVGHLRPKENPTAILSYSFHLSTKGGNTYFVKVVGERNERTCVNYASHGGSFIDVHSLHPHHDPEAGRQCSAGVPQGGKGLHPAQPMGPQALPAPHLMATLACWAPGSQVQP